MAEPVEVPLLLLTSTLENGLSLTQALLHPEVSRWGSARRPSSRALADSVRSRVEKLDPLELARRLPPADTFLTRWEVELDPPRDVPAWTEPVKAAFYVLKYEVGKVWAAYLPDLQATFFAPTEAELDERGPGDLIAEILRRRLNRLEQLAFLQRTRSLVTSTLATSARIPSLRQRYARQEKKPAPILRQVATDLTAQSLAPMYERIELVEQLAERLTGKNPRSLLLVGPSGVGKTAVFYELVRRRRQLQLGSTPFWETSGARLMGGQNAFGMWQQRCQRVIREAGRSRAIVHLGNLMELMQVGRHETSPFGMAGLFRLALARGEMLAVTECTPEQLTRIERDQPHLLEAFSQLEVPAPGEEQGLSILMQVACDLGFRGPVETIERVDALHRRFAAYSAFPGRPVRFLRTLVRAEPEARPQDVARHLAQETGLPLWLLDDRVPLVPREARDWFSSRVLGQPAAVDQVVERLAALKAGLTRPARPIASFLMIGPTGVGKTETARALAEFLFRDRNRLVRFDMSEFSDPFAVERLVGEEGLLTARVREHPFSVVLFDELEKAHPDFFDLLLQVLGEARLTDASGRLADFSNSVVLMTSNLGAQEFGQGSLGLRSRQDSPQEAFTAAVRAVFRPELFNRLDRILAYSPLDAATILSIARRELEQITLRDGLVRRPVALQLGPDTAERLAELGHDPRYGARPLKRALERHLMAPLAEELNRVPPEVGLEVRVEPDLSLRTRIVAGDAEARVRSAGAAVDRVSAVRRQGRLIAQGPLVTAVTNELHARRKKRGEFQPAQLLLDRLTAWRERVEQLEESSLLGLAESMRGAPFELQHLFSELGRLEEELDLLLLGFYERQHPGALATLGIYAQRSEQVLFLARAYAAMAAHFGWRVTLESVRLRKGDAENPVERRQEEAEKFLATPSQVLGVLMQCEGRLAQARLMQEGGPISFLRPQGNEPALIDVQPRPLRKPRDPEKLDFPALPGLHRQGVLVLHPRSRAFDLQRRRLQDVPSGLTRDWAQQPLEALLAIHHERFRKLVLEAALP